MFSEKLHTALNDQMNFEFYSSHVYLQMAAYASGKGYDGIANFYLVQVEEERAHAMMIYRYLAERDLPIQIAGFEMESSSYVTMLEVFETALAHEKIVTERVYNLANIAQEEREHATSQFLTWFINEQVEEEANFNKYIHVLNHISESSGDMLRFDQELAARVFVDPTPKQG